MSSYQPPTPPHPQHQPFPARSGSSEARLWTFLVIAVALLFAVVATGIIASIPAQSTQGANPVQGSSPAADADPPSYFGPGHDFAIAGWGNGQYGQLGNAQFIKDVPRAITDPTPNGGTKTPITADLGDLGSEEIKEVFAAENYAIALTTSGDIYYWGGPFSVAKPGPFEDLATTPTLFATADDFDGNKVTELALSLNYVVALTENNDLYSWGSHETGGLGIGKPETEEELDSRPAHDMYYEIQQVSTEAMEGRTIVDIDGGTTHTLALDDQGTVYAWGSGLGGQLGDEENYTGAIINFGAADSGAYQPVAIDTGALSKTKVTSISAGGHHSLALTSNGDVVAWGSNYVGQIADASSVSEQTTFDPPQATTVAKDITRRSGSEIVDLVAAHHSSYAVTANGELYSWGSNDHNQLGVDDTNTERAPEANPRPEKVGGDLTGEQVTDLAASRHHVLALTKSNTLFAWGLEDYGALGQNTVISGDEVESDFEDLSSIAEPTEVPFGAKEGAPQVVDIAVGTYFSLARLEP